MSRIESIDVLRGLTIFAMVFVNDAASLRNLPDWLKHVSTEVDGMTFVDAVFPAFLFIVGMAVPLAIEKRLKLGEKLSEIWLHILQRTIGLLVLGVLMVNTSELNEKAVGLDKHLWLFFVLVSAILVLNQYPGKEREFFTGKFLRGAGLAGLIILALIYRSGEEGNLIWFQTKWWGILGLIGWSYFFATAVYLFFRKNFLLIITSLFFFYLLFIIDRTGLFDFTKPFLYIGGHIGVHTGITIAGMIVTLFFFQDKFIKTPKSITILIIAFSAVLFLLGLILAPFYGISKIYATPTWGLYSSAYCSILFTFLYWIIDLKQQNRWSKFLLPAGKNPLLAYLLPDIYYSLAALFGFTLLSQYLGEGITGIIRSLIFALIMLGITALFNKFKVKLHL